MLEYIEIDKILRFQVISSIYVDVYIDIESLFEAILILSSNKNSISIYIDIGIYIEQSNILQ